MRSLADGGGTFAQFSAGDLAWVDLSAAARAQLLEVLGEVEEPGGGRGKGSPGRKVVLERLGAKTST